MIVEGKDYKVVENLGFVHSRSAYAKVVNCEGKERVAIKIGKIWKFAKPIFRKDSHYTGQSINPQSDKENR